MPKLQIDGQVVGEISEETAARLLGGVAGRQSHDLWQEKQLAEFQTQVRSEMKRPPPHASIADHFDLQLMRWTSLNDPNP